MSKKSNETQIKYRLTDEQHEKVSHHLYDVEALLESISSMSYLVTDTIPPEKGEVCPMAIDALAKQAFASIQKAVKALDEGAVK